MVYSNHQKLPYYRGDHILKLRFMFTLSILLLPHIGNAHQNTADLVVFSFDRPLQLYAFLESLQRHTQGINTTTVIYRTSNFRYEQGYGILFKDFPTVTFIKQGNNPQADFKRITLQATFKSTNNYILFAVDDIIVKDYVNISECIDALEKSDAYGFYLRMAPHLIQSYLPQDKQTIPPLTPITNRIFSWKFSEGRMDWAYPHTVDMTLYRKQQIKSDLHTMPYNNPNTLEAAWAFRANKIMHRIGLCFTCSKVVNIPLNQVQTSWQNPHMNYLTPAQLLTMFNEGKKININPIFQIKNPGSHMDYEPSFIQR